MPLRFKDEAEFQAWERAARGGPEKVAPTPPIACPAAVLRNPTAADARLAAVVLVRVVMFLLKACVTVVLVALQLVAAAANAALAVLLLVNVAGRIGHGRCGGH